MGLLVAGVAVRFHDTLDFNLRLLVLVGFLTPTFYPVRIVPGGLRPVIDLKSGLSSLAHSACSSARSSMRTWDTWIRTPLPSPCGPRRSGSPAEEELRRDHCRHRAPGSEREARISIDTIKRAWPQP